MKNKINSDSNSDEKNESQLLCETKEVSQNDRLQFSDGGYDCRKKRDNIPTPLGLAKKLQDIVDKIIMDCLVVDWSEDYLTYQVVNAIRNILKKYSIPNIKSNSTISKFDLETYKLTGNAEQTHGDIAVVVTHLDPNNNEPISGVGFYEAKASSPIYDANRGFPAFSMEQLNRLVANTPKLSYLLYDKKAQLSSSQEWLLSESTQDGSEFSRERFHSYTVNASFLKQWSRDIRAASYIVGESFGYHFVHKILSGKELDYSRPPIELIDHWLKVTRRTDHYVLSIAIQEECSLESNIKLQPLQFPSFKKLELQAPP